MNAAENQAAQAWIIEDADRYLTHIFVGTYPDAEEKAQALWPGGWSITGPFEFSIAVRPYDNRATAADAVNRVSCEAFLPQSKSKE